MKRTLLCTLALLLVFGLAACGKTPDEPPGTLTTALTTAAQTQPTAASTALTEEDIAAGAEPDGVFKEPRSIKEAIALYAAAVDRTLQLNPTVTKRVLKVIERPLQGDDSIMRLFGIDIAGYSVERTICADLFGEGDVTYVQPAREALQPCWLRESDVTGFTAKTLPGGDIELHLRIKDSTNPTKPWENEGPSPIGNVTWDFTSLKDIRDGIVDAQSTVPGLRINIVTIQTDFYNCQGKAVIRPDGTFVSLTHIADNKVRVEDVEVRLIGIRLGGGEWGGGTGHGTITYSNFQY